MKQTKVVICPYCGETQGTAERCRSCGGLFEPLSRQATHNAMGPWYVRDPGKPFHPGCSYETLVRMIDRGQVTKYSIVRGPTTKQYWTVAKHVPGVAHLLGYCHNCDASVDPGDHGCHVCGVPFGAYLDRNYLGLPDVRPLPWEVEIDESSAPSRTTSLRSSGAISGFASDDELLSSDSIDHVRRGSAHDGPTARAPHESHEISDDEGSSVFDEYTSSAMARALRRKLSSQQRTIRVLAVLLVAVILVSVVANLGALASIFAPAPPDIVATSPIDIAAPVGPAENAPLASPEPTPAAPLAEGDPLPAAPIEDPLMVAHAEALKLIADAELDDRSIDERIGDYERALRGLEAIETTAPQNQRPAGLTELITQVKRELERLRLERDFFGG